MANDKLQQLLSSLSAQTGQPMPSAQDIQSFLNMPGSQYLIQTILGTQSETLTEAASLARSGNFDDASDLIRSYLKTSDGQELMQRLAQKGDSHE